MKNQPKTESWAKRLGYWCDWFTLDGDVLFSRSGLKKLREFIRHEKQLSYQEAVEDALKLVSGEENRHEYHCDQCSALFDGWNLRGVDLRNQLSILKGENE